MSYRTVRTHLERLYDLNGVRCRAALVALVALRRDLTEQREEPDQRAIWLSWTAPPCGCSGALEN
jgi:hypothetical protein